MKVFYFGCWDRVDHFLWMPCGDSVPMSETPWGNAVDGGLCPGKRDQRGEVAPVDQREGHAALHHRDGWTALAFWDRSVDKRPNSNSAFLAEGTLTMPEMMTRAWASFPGIMDRFEVALYVDGVSEGRP